MLVGSISTNGKEDGNESTSDAQADDDTDVRRRRSLLDGDGGFLLTVREVVVTRVHIMFGASASKGEQSAAKVGAGVVQFGHLTTELERIGEGRVTARGLATRESMEMLDVGLDSDVEEGGVGEVAGKNAAQIVLVDLHHVVAVAAILSLAIVVVGVGVGA